MASNPKKINLQFKGNKVESREKSFDCRIPASFPKISPTKEFEPESQLLATHHKAFDWKYEEEYRFTKLQYPKPFELNERVIKVPDKYIAEVLIGLKTAASVEKEITELCKLKNIPVFKLTHDPFKFKFVRDKIY